MLSFNGTLNSHALWWYDLSWCHLVIVMFVYRDLVAWLYLWNHFSHLQSSLFLPSKIQSILILKMFQAFFFTITPIMIMYLNDFKRIVWWIECFYGVWHESYHELYYKGWLIHNVIGMSTCCEITCLALVLSRCKTLTFIDSKPTEIIPSYCSISLCCPSSPCW